VSLGDIANPAAPRFAWEAGEAVARMTGETGDLVRVDGRRVSAAGTFTDEVSGRSAEGSLSAVCP
jgi:hypothetical protein